MKRIAWTFPAANSSRAALAVILALLPVSLAAASTRPQMGGTLRVQISERIDNLDPRQWPSAPGQAAAAERLGSLVFDRLVRLDEHGALRPALAVSWEHDAQSKRWQFRLREGVKFSDGTQLTPPVAAMALQQLLGISFDVSAAPDSLVIEASQPVSDLPARLATGRYFVFRAGENGSLTGTGPFVYTILESFGRPAQAIFVANDSCWAGRPFVDKISVSMNVEIEQQANGIAFGQADIVDLPAAQVRRTAQRGVRTVSSDPVELFALLAAADRPPVRDARLREAISLAIDRASIADVIFQKQGVPAGSLLPNWISGYAHLFPPTFDLARAKDLLAASGRELSRSSPLVLVYDSSDAEARAVADRVAVNLREAGIVVQVSGQPADGKTKSQAADLRLVRRRVISPDASAALSELLASFGEGGPAIETLDQAYASERNPIDGFRVIPIVHVTESYGLSPQVRDWMAPRWGGWDLADVWLRASGLDGEQPPMSFRNKLMIVFVVTIVAAVTLVAWGVSLYTRRAFEEFDRQRSDALVAQFRREYAQRGDEIAHRVQSIADAEATLRMAMDLNRPQADASQYYNDARSIAQSQQLDFVDIAGDDGALISSAEWPARFGYKNDWVTAEPDWNSKGAFLRRMDMPDSVDLGLLAVRTVRVGDKRLFLIGGQRLDQNFLATLVLPEGMRALLYRNLEQGFIPAALTDSRGPVGQPELFSSLISDVQQNRKEVQRTIASGAGPNADSENFNAIPLVGRDRDLLGVLLVGSSRENLIQMLGFIRALALVVGGGVILLGLVLGWWVSSRVTRPIEELAAGAREVAEGHWEARVNVRSRDEIGQLAEAFNEMTRQLSEQRERLVQTERVAAWRELARRLAHELKNPLFPLQLTVENLQRAREQTSEQFDEVFFESTATLREELENLKAIVSRFSDFAKMPPPQFEPVDVNELVRGAVKLFEPQMAPVGRPPITPELYLDESLPRPQADPILLRRALENLILNSLDAMPAGGTLTVRTSQRSGAVRLEVTDTGEGLTPEECARLFTPYYTTKRLGTGLGLAIVQSVVSDHGGRIEVESAPGAGATFRIELPLEQKTSGDSANAAEGRPVAPRFLLRPDRVAHR